jgi:hypothetical protein
MFKAQMVAIMDISPIGNYAQFRKRRKAREAAKTAK